MKVAYKNLFNASVGEYDPETEGFFAVGFVAGFNGTMADGRRLDLGTGCIGTPTADRARAEREFAGVVAQWPEVAPHCRLYKVPFALSNRESWVELADRAPEELVVMARKVDWTWWMARDNWKNGDSRYLATLRV
jgi:hypothetical protein